MLAQAPGDAALVQALEEERHVAILLERKAATTVTSPLPKLPT
jgi:hypothetical protein